MRMIALLALALAACAQPQQSAPPSTSAPQSELAQRIRADLNRLDAELAAPDIVATGINESADLGGGMSVRVTELIEDSRCPANVTCIWAGRLRVRAVISGAGERELTLGEPAHVNGREILLAVAKPSPWSDWPTPELGPAPAYRFGFRRA